MKKTIHFFMAALGSGLLVLIPGYLVGLLMLKAMKSLAGIVHPLSRLAPAAMSPSRSNPIISIGIDSNGSVGCTSLDP